ncbi:CoA-binding protein [Candidatus Nomurabacteria bacterium]|uniref:CoA-binding protein n=1 Tax=Candidatus Dojkabacteria bacterium TaxID=2099670 RepID=A0A955I3I8_9BACT|nr:CoA-binding protein [Candidatus Dojkabacteria bacterium]MCB9803917.1 CoA-binding protein [Candidatus Nomurabacteria bacterium]
MISKKLTYAIVGASNDVSKYGYKVLKNLKDSGFHVIPVNLKEDKILDLPVSHSLSEIEPKPDVVVTVVPPTVTMDIVKQVVDLGIGSVWMQPGSESDEAIAYCEENGVSVISGACIMSANL